jgi:3-oxoacyl-[acyl-carrier-protein] synthase II
MPAIEPSVPSGVTGGEAEPLPLDYRADLPRAARYLRWTAEHALIDAALDCSDVYLPARRYIVLGTTLHGIRAGGRFLRSNDPSELGSFLAGSICAQAIDGLEMRGGAMTTCSACSSSLSAITLGTTLLESGQADMVVAGGYDAISEYAWAGFNALRLIAKNAVRPFCRDRDGMKVAEGYGLVVLERADAASQRGAPIRAHIAGWGESADSHHLTKPHPRGDGALAAIQMSLDRAGLSASEVDLIAAHATGTPDNDASEYAALSRLLASDLAAVPVIGFKSFLGHTLGGAGAVELVMSCKALRDQCIPATPKINPGEVEFDDLSLSIGKTRSSSLRVTLNTSLGFGGANECLILKSPATPVQACPLHSRRVTAACITGVGVVLPGAIGNSAFQSLMAADNGPSTQQCCCDVDEQLLAPYLQARRVRRLSLLVKLTLAAATIAIRDAGVSEHSETLANACAILGSMHGPVRYCHDYYSQVVSEGALAANPMLFAEGVPNAASAHVSTTLGIKGSCQTIIGSMTSGLDALSLAALRIESGAAEAVLVVASEEASHHVDRAYSGAQANGALDAIGKSTSASVAFLVESSVAVAARNIEPYACVVQSCQACSPLLGCGGPVSSISSVLRRLDNAGPVLPSHHGSWMERAEFLGIKRAGVTAKPCPMARFTGNLFSVAPMANLASTLIDPPETPRCIMTSLDITGAAAGVCIEHGLRRLV